MAEVDQKSAIENELYNWCSKVLEKLGKCNGKTEEQWYEYIFWQLSVMYKCSKDDNPILLHPNHKRLIEENIISAIKIYFHDYRKYEAELPKLEVREEPDELGINRHMFCKYPILKTAFGKTK